MDGIGQALCIGVDDQHLPGTNERRFPEAIFQIHSRDTFQDDELDVRVSMIFHQNGRPGDRRSHGGGGDFCAAGAFGHLQEHGPAAKIESARPFVEAKNRVRS